jgi:hypothetical protein
MDSKLELTAKEILILEEKIIDPEINKSGSVQKDPSCRF